jgi:hypothetical protein
MRPVIFRGSYEITPYAEREGIPLFVLYNSSKLSAA